MYCTSRERALFIIFFLFVCLVYVVVGSIDEQSSDYVITTIAGYSRGSGYWGEGTNATFDSERSIQPTLLYSPTVVRVDSAGNIYVADKDNNALRMVNITTGIITSIISNSIKLKDFRFDQDENIYFIDSDYVKFLDRKTQQISIIAGTETYSFSENQKAMDAFLAGPSSIFLDKDNNIYLTCMSTPTIRFFNRTTGNITIIAGTGKWGYSGDGDLATKATLYYPQCLALDSDENVYFVENNCVVRFINKSNGIISTIIGKKGYCQSYGDGGLAKDALVNIPYSLLLDKDRNIYITDTYSGLIRFVNASTNIISTFISNADLRQPTSITFDNIGNWYIADTDNHVIKKGNIQNPETVTTILGISQYFGLSGDGNRVNFNVTTTMLNSPSKVIFDENDNMYISDTFNNLIRFVDRKNNTIRTIAGVPNVVGPPVDNIQATTSKLYRPDGMALKGMVLYFSDSVRNVVRKVDLVTGIISLFAGSYSNSQLNGPSDIVFDSEGNMYIADTNNNAVKCVRKSDGLLFNYAGGSYGFAGDGGLATSAKMYYPHGVAFDSKGDLYIADTYNHVIRKVDKNTKKITTIAGIPEKYGYNGDGIPATSANLKSPFSISFDSLDNLYIGDTENQRIRMVNKNGTILTLVGNGQLGHGGEGDGGNSKNAKITRSYTLGVTVHKDVIYFTQKSSVRMLAKSLFCYGELSSSPDACSSRGNCTNNGTCICPSGWNGSPDCSQLSCDTVSCTGNSYCSGPNECSCNPGWSNSNCSSFNCYTINNCSNHGQCISNNTCSCDSGWFGKLCSTCSCFGLSDTDPLVCSGLGKCLLPDICTCNTGYSGSNCSEFTCFGTDSKDSRVCSGNGACLSYNTCSCKSGYIYHDCSSHSCYGNAPNSSKVCSGNGNCESLDQCKCSSGYAGELCELVNCYGKLSNDSSVCSSHGSCVGVDSCQCNKTHDGILCEHEIPICFSISSLNKTVCSSHGQCLNFDNCTCSDGWHGKVCNISTCFNLLASDPSVCSGHGICSSIDTCTCDFGWFGSSCSLTKCMDVWSNNSSVCSNRGNCTDFNTCACNDGYFGIECKSFLCNGIDGASGNVCSGNGNCTDLNACKCSSNYYGDDCEKIITCFGTSITDEKACSSRGVCSSLDHCVCRNETHGSVHGSQCEIVDCYTNYFGPKCELYCRFDVNCSSHGECLHDGRCECHSNSSLGFFEGNSCNTCQQGYYGDICLTRFIPSSLVFSNMATELLFKLYAPSTASSQVHCKDLVPTDQLPLLGNEPQCLWKDRDNGEFAIVLGNSPTIKVGFSLKINTNVFNKVYSSNYVDALVQNPPNPIKPMSAISSNSKIIGVCDSVTLDGATSSTTDGGSLLFRWSIIYSPPLFKSISESQLNSSLLNLDSSIPAGDYSVTLVVTSTLFHINSELSFFNFTKKTINTPQIGIYGPTDLIVEFVDTPIYIKKFPIFSFECANQTNPTNSLSFKWTQLEGPQTVNFTQLENGDLYIVSFKEQAYQKYVFEVSMKYLSDWVYKTITITTTEEQFSVVLYQSFINSSQVVINVETNPLETLNSLSKDIKWNWTCVSLPNRLPCELDIQQTLIDKCLSREVQFSLPSANSKKIELSLQIRNSIGIIEIEFPQPNQILPIVNLVSLNPLKTYYLTTDKLSIQLMVSLDGFSDGIDDLITREWKLNGATIISSMTLGITNPSTSNLMILDLSTLGQATKNNLTFTATSISSKLSASYSLSFEISSNPKPCQCSVTPSSGYILDTTYQIVCLQCLTSETTISIGFIGLSDVKSTLMSSSSSSSLSTQLPYISSDTLTLFAISTNKLTGASSENRLTVKTLLPKVNSIVEAKKKKLTWDNTYKSISNGDPRKLVYSYNLQAFNALQASLGLRRIIRGSHTTNEQCSCTNNMRKSDCSMSLNDWTNITSTKWDTLNLVKDEVGYRSEFETMTENLFVNQITILYQLVEKFDEVDEEMLQMTFDSFAKLVRDGLKSPRFQVSESIFNIMKQTLSHFTKSKSCIDNYQLSTSKLTSNFTAQLISLMGDVSTLKERSQLLGSSISLANDLVTLVTSKSYPIDLSNRKVFYGSISDEVVSFPNKITSYLQNINLRKTINSRIWKTTRKQDTIESVNGHIITIVTSVGFSLSSELLNQFVSFTPQKAMSFSFHFNSNETNKVETLSDGRLLNTTFEMICLSDVDCDLVSNSNSQYICKCGNAQSVSLAQRVTKTIIQSKIQPVVDHTNLGYLGFLAFIVLIVIVPIVIVPCVLLIKKSKKANPNISNDVPMKSVDV